MVKVKVKLATGKTFEVDFDLAKPISDVGVAFRKNCTGPRVFYHRVCIQVVEALVLTS